MGGMLRGASAAAALAMLVTTPAQAQEGGTVIHVVYRDFFEQVRPNYWAGEVNDEIMVTLSGKNDVREDWKMSIQGASGSWRPGAALGDARWRVLGPHALQRTVDGAQSRRVDTIEITGEQCRAPWQARLKPGFAEYALYSIGLKQMAFYRQARMESSICEIHSR